MLFTFEKRDEGFFAFRVSDGRAVCHVETKEVTFSDHVDGDPAKPKLARPQKFEKLWPRERWQLHFTGVKQTPVELEAFLTELGAQQG